jgi:hypothetical protein
MAGSVDYKQKYSELKARFMSAVDSAWQDGYQHGMADSQVEQAQQEKQQADAMAAGMGQPGQPGQEGEVPAEGEQPQADAPVSQNPNGDDQLGQHIEKLESMIGKSEISTLELGDLKKTLNDIKSLQIQMNLTKSMESIKNTRLAKSHQPIKFTKKLEANIKEPAKKALSLQQEILGNVFSKWEKDESKAASDIGSILNIEGLTKKD